MESRKVFPQRRVSGVYPFAETEDTAALKTDKETRTGKWKNQFYTIV